MQMKEHRLYVLNGNIGLDPWAYPSLRPAPGTMTGRRAGVSMGGGGRVSGRGSLYTRQATPGTNVDHAGRSRGLKGR